MKANKNERSRTTVIQFTRVLASGKMKKGNAVQEDISKEKMTRNKKTKRGMKDAVKEREKEKVYQSATK